LALVSATKHGFRGIDDSVSLTLIRSSYDPDPTPEYGEHRFRFAVAVAADPDDRRAALASASDFCHPLVYQSGTVHPGTLPAEGSFLALESGAAAVTAVKLPEEDPSGQSVLVRLHETDGKVGEARLRFDRPVASVLAVDLNERQIMDESGSALEIKGKTVHCMLQPWSVTGFLAEFL